MKLIECQGSHNIYKVMTELTDVSNKEIIANSVDAAVEKHVPQYEIKEDKVEIVVNHVMEEDRLIEWIMVEYEDLDITKYFKAFDKVPNILWDDEYQKYREVLNKYKDIKVLRWASN